MVEPTLPLGKKNDGPPPKKKLSKTINLSKIKDFFYAPLSKYCKTWFYDIWHGKYLCAEKIHKFRQICKNCKIVMHAKISCFTVNMSENMFFFILKNQAKTYKPCHEKQWIYKSQP